MKSPLELNTACGSCSIRKSKLKFFLHTLKLSSDDVCALCGNDKENINHLFNTYPKTWMVWWFIEERTCVFFVLRDNIVVGFWLENIKTTKNFLKASIITTTVWFIWKARCYLIFKCI